MKKEFTLTRALVELKLYDSKINKSIDELKPVNYSVNNIVVEERKTPEEFINNYKSQMQSVEDLRKNKIALKNALMHANATTEVIIGGVKYTILQAINKKQEINIERSIVQKLRLSLLGASAKVNNINSNVEANIENVINSKSASNGNQSKDYIQSVRNSYENQKAKLVNDEEIQRLIEVKENEIETFLAEVDFALSEINAITKITVGLA